MKKILYSFIFIVSIFILSGCGQNIEKGNYKAGTYFGFDDNRYQVTIVVDKDGFIAGAFIDAATYVNDVKCSQDDVDSGTLDAEGNLCVLDEIKVEGFASTKQQLGDAYCGTWDINWRDQMNIFGAKIVKEQGYDWAAFYETEAELLAGIENKSWNPDRLYFDQTIDGIAGVTIHVENLDAIILDLLSQAKAD